MATNSGNHKKSTGKNVPQKGTAPRTGGKKLSAKQRKAKKRKRIILFTVEIVALVVLLTALVSVLMITKMDKVKINPEDIAVNPEVEENKEMKGYRNIALFGVDSSYIRPNLRLSSAFFIKLIYFLETFNQPFICRCSFFFVLI